MFYSCFGCGVEVEKQNGKRWNTKITQSIFLTATSSIFVQLLVILQLLPAFLKHSLSLSLVHLSGPLSVLEREWEERSGCDTDTQRNDKRITQNKSHKVKIQMR